VKIYLTISEIHSTLKTLFYSIFFFVFAYKIYKHKLADNVEKPLIF